MSSDDLPGLPEGWAWTTIGEIYNTVGGGTPSTQESGYWGGDIPWITSADIHGLQDIQPRKFITPQAIEGSTTRLVPAGSLIVVTRVGLGKVAIAPTALCFSQDSQALVGILPLIDPKCALYYLSQAVQIFRYENRGTTIPGVTKKQLQALSFPLAPLAEQRRIVDAIEALFSKLDAGVAALKRAQRQVQRYKASVLKAACEGHLVPQDPHDEPASVLLRRILAERQATWQGKGKYQEPAGPDTAGLPYLPEGWVWASLGQILSESLSNGRSVPTAEEGFPVLRLTALQAGRVDLAQRKLGAWGAGEATPYLVQQGDFFIARGNGSLRLVGRGALVEREPDPVAYPDTMIKVRLHESVCDPRYLRAVWDSNFIRAQVESFARTSAGIYKVNQQSLLTCILPLPPLAEQQRIVAEVERRLSVAAALEQSIEATLKRAERLRQSILKRAFSGQLVPQDPTDEPARVLLARIRREKAKGAKGKQLGLEVDI